MADVDLDKSLRRGVAWLVGAQSEDGGWHSHTYGALRGGAATTAIVLYALSRIPAAIREVLGETIPLAVKFLTPGMQRRKAVACPDGTLDYPVYATAQVLIAAESLPLELPAESIAALREYLYLAQLNARQGFRPDDVHYGGWDLAGAATASRPSTGSNISFVRFALEGLAAPVRHSESAAVREADEARRRVAVEAALAWLERCQRSTQDGGFAFSTEPAALENKAQWSDPARRQPRSYGTATCDGLRALVACGVEATDERRRRAAQWLDGHWSAAAVPGLPDNEDGRAWSMSMYFYYAATLCDAIDWFSTEADRAARRRELASAIVGQQREDGSWRSDFQRMREDDPLVATSLAVAALGRLAPSA